MRTEVFANDGYYHVYNRGVDKRVTFFDEADYKAFLEDIWNIFHDKTMTVELAAYALMPNHYHFLLRQVADEGVSKFMQRLGTAYTKYFNKRYERTGSLFQGPFKVVPITNNGQLEHLTRYIHRNPLDLCDVSTSRRWSWLLSYPWSSLGHYIGQRRDVLVKCREILQGFSGPQDYFFIRKRLWISGRS